MSSKAVVLLSGGLDSTTVAAVAKDAGHEIFALTINYNQRHQCELDAAERVADFFGIAHRVVFPLDLRLFGGSALTDASGKLAVPKDVPIDQIGRTVPSTYVPARNTIFLSLALAYAETVDAKDIYIGVSSVDSSGYPDCRPEFLSAYENLANVATRPETGSKESSRFRIIAPLVSLNKAETIKLGVSLGVNYGLTWTCYDPVKSNKQKDSFISCGRCESCTLRLRGFRDAGFADPIEYEKY
ncbi:MAG: 7-cyano-7-deazaguanine synthase QueC [Thermoguttaceae bacterium]